MKKIIVIVFCTLLFMPLLIVKAEEISNFDVQISIKKDATFDVVETILYDFGDDSKHGFYREIPVKYKTVIGNSKSISLDNITVTDENHQKRTFVVNKGKKIEIGDANKLVTGKQVYIISYTVDGAINYFDNSDELYWNVTGDEWPVRIRTTSVTVDAPNITQIDCFAGGYSSTKKCHSITQEASTAQFLHEGIEPTEGVTVVIGMPPGTVYQPTFFEKIVKLALDNWVLFTPVAVFFFMWYIWYRFGRDPEGRGTIVPYYESPDNLSPAEVGMIVDEKVHSRDISALLVNLAGKV